MYRPLGLMGRPRGHGSHAYVRVVGLGIARTITAAGRSMFRESKDEQIQVQPAPRRPGRALVGHGPGMLSLNAGEYTFH